MAKQYPSLSHGAIDLEFIYPGGESTRSMIERSRAAVDLFQKTYSESEKIVVVAHTGSLNSILHYLLGVSLDGFPAFKLENGKITKIVRPNMASKFYRIEALNV
jgi:broad specificity phosphatase PhoE